MSASQARLVQLLGPAVEATGADLEDVSVSPAGKRRVVRVLVDKNGGITLDDVAEVSRAVSEVLDALSEQVGEAGDDLLGGAYVLEVSSPGVDRPLTEPRHWRRNLGRLVAVTLADGSAFTGRVLASDEAEAVLDVDGTERTLLLAEVTRAAVQVEFTKADDEGDEA